MAITTKQIALLQQELGAKVKENFSLAPLTWFKIGGRARVYFEAEDNSQIVHAILTAKMHKVPFFVIAGGANVLITDNDIDKFVIKLNSKDLIVNKNQIIADSGVSLADVVQVSIENGLSGLVWASGVPGSVGGAVRGNAGAYGGDMSQIVSAVEIIRGNRQMVLKREKIDFGYRDSMFKHNSDIILTVSLDLKYGGKKDEMALESQKIIEERKAKHPQTPSAGSYFKNIVIDYTNKEIFEKLDIPEKFWGFGKVAAGWLIDKLDMKGFKVGGAMVSSEHANIIINIGQAKASDVLEIASIIKTRVRDEFGIKLEEEVQYIAG